jgi:regulator of protease activity HflC (stomatin/prohibitin superfamily)
MSKKSLGLSELKKALEAAQIRAQQQAPQTMSGDEPQLAAPLTNSQYAALFSKVNQTATTTVKGSNMIIKSILAAIIAVAVGLLTKSPGTAIGVFILAFLLALVIETITIVPQQEAFVVESLGKYSRTLQPGFNWIVPFIERVSYKHSLKEVPLDVPEQVCITRDNTQLAVDGIVYYQVVDPKLASYGSSDYVLAITQLAQTTLRSEIGKMEMDRTFESRDEINMRVVAAVDEAARTWGVKVMRYELKNLTPPEAILRSMQAQITAEREKRALIAKSEGQRQEEINLADGEKQAAVLRSEGEKTAAINKAQGDATAIQTIATATADAVKQVAEALNMPGGHNAANLKIAEQYINAFGNLAKTNNTLVVPANVADVSGMLATAMTVLDKSRVVTQKPV